jgi:catechol 2,3-dioxygenase-like lactoylglutathione lyase family enzyme
MQSLACVALVVPDYDEAITHYTRDLGFTLVEDTHLNNGQRWVLVAPPGQADATGTKLLLAKAKGDLQAQRIGDQTGGRVFLFLRSDDFWRDYHAYQARGVQFLETPREESYATVVVFQDKFGNKWDLLQPKAQKA